MEYSELFRTTLDLEEEKREHTLVMEAIKDLEAERKCWRLVGGVLVERNLGEVMQSLRENIEFLDKTSANYGNALKIKEKDLFEFEIKYNLRPTREGPKKEDA
jgi:prefoldin subunit 2